MARQYVKLYKATLESWVFKWEEEEFGYKALVQIVNTIRKDVSKVEMELLHEWGYKHFSTPESYMREVAAQIWTWIDRSRRARRQQDMYIDLHLVVRLIFGEEQ